MGYRCEDPPGHFSALAQAEPTLPLRAVDSYPKLIVNPAKDPGVVNPEPEDNTKEHTTRLPYDRRCTQRSEERRREASANGVRGGVAARSRDTCGIGIDARHTSVVPA